MSGKKSNMPMSIDAMLDMERQEVLALLENKANQASSTTAEQNRSASPYAASRSPVRSMLDIDEEPDADDSKGRRSPVPSQAPVRSMLDIGGPAPPAAAPMRSLLDIGGPSSGRSSSSQGRRSQPVSPVMSNASLYKGPSASMSRLHPRSSSDAGMKPVDFGPRRSGGGLNDRTSEYQFSGFLPQSNSAFSLGKAPTRSKRPSAGSSGSNSSALAEALRTQDFSGLQLPGDRGRKSSFGNKLNSHTSKSPHNRWSSRSRSPATFASLLGPNKAMLDDGQVVDISSAYRRLSDANLAFSSGSLSQLPHRKKSDDAGDGRLIKDYLGPNGEQLESSDEDEPFSSDDEDRGRNKAPRSLSPDEKRDNKTGGQARSTLSLLAAADEERSKVAKHQSYQYRSLIPEPEIKITNSSGDTVKPTKGGVHPNTSYDQNPTSATPSVIDSDEEADMDDIMRAQKLSFSMTNILHNSEAHRSIRIIYRGEYHKIAHAAEEDNQRLRKYLVATDLSDESTHALEWAIGTVLRDGDTLIAINCVDEETGILTADHVPDDPHAMKEQATAINTVTNAKVAPAPLTQVTEFSRKQHSRGASTGGGARTPGVSPAPGGMTKPEEERQRAIQEMTTRILKLLRKTKLQVRVIVEVLHCKNPRHLITEVIDVVNPTLVVIGSRGRSALKGVILGSFSNYLVTKSSVPVMVARKRLRKQSKYKRTDIRQVNMLSNPTARSLANAKID